MSSGDSVRRMPDSDSRRGPVLEHLTRRLAECPPDFTAEPRDSAGGGTVSVMGVVYDLLLELGGSPLSPLALKRFAPLQPASASGATNEHRRQALILIVAWLLHDPWFRNQGPRALPGALADLALLFLSKGVDELAETVLPARFIDDGDRREELVRRVLKGLNLRPEGESEAVADDRLSALDSVERARLIRSAREVEKKRAEERKAREIREEAQRKKREAEAAATYGRE
ncbi:MAG: hypothetical protein WA705_10150 [Candidatus Ozemobacteraceae bacterium]